MPVEGFDDPDTYVNPFAIPQRYGGNAADNDLGKKHEGETFDIRTTSAADAQKIYDEHQRLQDEKNLQEQSNDVLGGAGKSHTLCFEWNRTNFSICLINKK